MTTLTTQSVSSDLARGDKAESDKRRHSESASDFHRHEHICAYGYAYLNEYEYTCMHTCLKKSVYLSGAWWATLVIPVLRMLRQTYHHGFETSLGYVSSSIPGLLSETMLKQANMLSRNSSATPHIRVSLL